MSKNFIFKVGLAFGLVVIVLAFLGINFVPSATASSSTKETRIDSSQSAIPDFIQRHLASVSHSVRITDPDWIERRTASVSHAFGYNNPDWVERHMPAMSAPDAKSSSNYYDNSDWVERHSKQVNP